MKKIKKLPQAEEKLMLAVWDSTPPVARNVLSNKLAQENWSDPTILTMLSRLVKKNFLKCEKQGNKNMYTPLISKEEYMAWESISLGKKMRNVSLAGLMAAFMENNDITDDDINQLEKMIEDYRKSK